MVGGRGKVAASGHDLVAKQRPLAVGHRRNARRLCTAFFRPRRDHDTRESRLLKFAADQRRIVVAVWRSRQESGRIGRKQLGERLGHLIGKFVFLDAVPDVEKVPPTGLQHPPRFAIGRDTVGEEHRAELAADEAEARVFERQGLGIRLAPFDVIRSVLLRGGVIEHRLIEVGCQIAGTGRQAWGQPAGHDAGPCGDFENIVGPQ